METNEEYLGRLLPKLAQEIPYQWRVQSYTKAGDSCTVVAYIDARDAMDLLDSHCTYGWTNKYELIDEEMFSHLGVYMPNGEIMWRCDNGTESQTEQVKGRSSDSFKRSAVRWGVGRFLYALEIKRLTASPNSGKPYPIDDNGKRIWNITDHVNKSLKAKKPQAPVQPSTPKQPDPQKEAPKADHSVELNWFKKFENDWITKSIPAMKAVRDANPQYKDEPLSASVADFMKNNQPAFRKLVATALSK